MPRKMKSIVRADPDLHPTPGPSTLPVGKRDFTSDVDKERILKSYLNGKSVRDISDILDINKRRVELIIKKYAKTGRLKTDEPKPTTTPVSGYKLSEEQAEIVRQWVGEDAGISGQELLRRIMDQFNVSMSISAVYRYIGCFVFSIKRMTVAPTTQNDNRTLNLRRDYAQIYSDLPYSFPDTDIIFAGQMRFKMSIRDRESKGRVRMRNMSIMVAITRADAIVFCGQNPPIGREQYQDFILSVIDVQRTPTGILIMDEGEFKEESETLNQLVLAKDFTNIFLPPHSPFLNPLETLFSELRDLLMRANPQNEAELVQAVEDGKRFVTPDDCERYFSQMAAYIPRCSNGEMIEPNDLYSIYADALREDEEAKQNVIIRSY